MVNPDKNMHGDEMDTAASSKEKKQESLSGKTQAIAVGLVLAIIGSLISSSYAKETLTNYTGFAMLLAGIAIFVFGIFATATAALKTRLRQDAPMSLKVRKPRVLFVSVWSVGIAVVLTAIGFLLRSTNAQYTLMNEVGYEMLLAGACVFLIGLGGVMVTTVTVRRIKRTDLQMRGGTKQPRARLYGQLSLGAGIVITVVGSMVAGSYAKETMMNYAGFGTLLIGIAILSIGISQTVVMVLKNRWNLIEKGVCEDEPRVMLGSIWAIGIGAMLVINGSLIASSYAKSTLMNYAGFGMLLAGTGVFVYGLFQTARISATSAMGYLTSKRAHSEICGVKEKEKLSIRLRSFGTNLVKTSAILNLAGVMAAMGLFFFSLWQLDIIVSGPVWWSDGVQGWSWPGPGAYADAPFQCFLWKTTYGQAYDTLFLLIFISFIVLFASAFFWPRWRAKND